MSAHHHRVSPVRLSQGGRRYIQVSDEQTGEVVALVPYSDRGEFAHHRSYHDAQAVAAGLNAVGHSPYLPEYAPTRAKEATVD